MDLVFVAGYLITQVTVQADQFPIRRHQVAGNVAWASFPTQEHACNGHGIEPVRFGPQSLLLVILVGLAWMQQTERIATLLQFMIELLPLAGGGLHPHQDAARGNSKLFKLLHKHLPSGLGIGEFHGLDDHPFIRSTNTA